MSTGIRNLFHKEELCKKSDSGTSICTEGHGYDGSLCWKCPAIPRDGQETTQACPIGASRWPGGAWKRWSFLPGGYAESPGHPRLPRLRPAARPAAAGGLARSLRTSLFRGMSPLRSLRPEG